MTYQPKSQGKMAGFETFIGNLIENAEGTNDTRIEPQFSLIRNSFLYSEKLWCTFYFK